MNTSCTYTFRYKLFFVYPLPNFKIFLALVKFEKADKR